MHSFYRSHFGSRKYSKAICTMWAFNLLGTLVSALCSTSTDAEKFEAPTIDAIKTDDTRARYFYKRRNFRPIGEDRSDVIIWTIKNTRLEWPNERRKTRLSHCY